MSLTRDACRTSAVVKPRARTVDGGKHRQAIATEGGEIDVYRSLGGVSLGPRSIARDSNDFNSCEE